MSSSSQSNPQGQYSKQCLNNLPNMSTDGASRAITPIIPPTLSRWGNEDISTFLEKMTWYVENAGAQPGVKLVSWASCIDPRLMHGLLVAREFFPAKSTSELNDDLISRVLQQRVAKVTPPPDFETLKLKIKKTVRCCMQDSDPCQRIRMLRVDFCQALYDMGLQNFVEESPKNAINIFLELIRPAALQNKLLKAADFNVFLKKDFFAFSDLAIEKAEECDEWASVFNNQLSNYQQTNGNPTERKSEKSYPKTKNQSHQSSTNRSSPQSEGPPKCLNPDCNERHLLRNCKNTPNTLKKQLFEKRAEDFNKSSKNSGNNKSNGPRGSSENRYGRSKEKIGALNANKSKPSAGQKLNESKDREFYMEYSNFRFACRADSGSDALAVSQSIIDFLTNDGNFIPIRSVQTCPNLTGVDGQPLKITGESCLSPTLVTGDSSVKLRHLRCLIFKNTNTVTYPGNACAGEFILGEPFLQSMGLDTYASLSNALANLENDFDMSKIDPIMTDPTATIGRLGARLMSSSTKSKNDIKDVSTDSINLPLNPLEDKKLVKNISRLCFGDLHAQDGDDIDYQEINVGHQDQSELTSAIDNMLIRAYSNLPHQHHKDLQKLVNKYREVFRTTLGEDPPVDVPPLVIKFKTEERPVKVKQRTYSPTQISFLKSHIKELEKLGLIFRNPTSAWACAPLLVTKPSSPSGFRFTVDLRPVNAQTKKAVWPMPNADAELARLTGACYFAKFDFVSAYWQMPLDKISQESQSFHTPMGVYTPKRVLHGCTNAVSFFQSTMEQLFNAQDVLIWLDDILAHAKTSQELLQTLDSIFRICSRVHLKLNPDKCHLNVTEATFCGRIISSGGYRFNPRHLDALVSVSAPSTVGELHQLVHGANWMRMAIPAFSTLMQPLQEYLELEYKNIGSRKKTAAIKRQLTSWTPTLQSSFKALLDSLKHQVTLHIYDPKQHICLFTDASDHFWSGVLTQVPNEDYEGSEPISEWRHVPLAFVSGAFKGAQLRWSTPEQECYGIIASVKRLSHILATSAQFALFTDHRNLTFMLSPARYNSNVARHVVNKVHRWSLLLSEFNFTVEHIAGVDNIWADMLTRWAAPDRKPPSSARAAAIRVPLLNSVLPNLPSIEVIREAQQKFLDLKKYSPDSDGLIRTNSGKLIIHDHDEVTQLRVCVSAHCGLGGHRGIDSTVTTISNFVYWKTMSFDVQDFVRSCLVCLLSADGNKVPRPLGSQIHASKVGELLHFDYLYVSPSEGKEEYILILKDDFSGYVHLTACKNADSITASDTLHEYFSIFSPVLNWFSDQGPHFVNEIISNLARLLGVRHDFSTAYAPWSNGTVEAVCKQVLRGIRSLTLDLEVPEAQWPRLVRGIQSIINNSPSRRLNGLSPYEVHTGQKCGNPLAVALSTPGISITENTVADLDQCRILQNIEIQNIHESLDKMHRDVERVQSAERQAAIRRHNKKTHIREYSPIIGDYVVVSRTEGARTKASTNWVGPRQIVTIRNQFIVVVEHLLTGTTSEVHISRLKPYVDSEVGASIDLETIADRTDRIWQTVSKLEGIKEDCNGKIQILTSWKGLQSNTWEPLTVMAEDVPLLLSEFLDSRRSSRIIRTAREMLKVATEGDVMHAK